METTTTNMWVTIVTIITLVKGDADICGRSGITRHIEDILIPKEEIKNIDFSPLMGQIQETLNQWEKVKVFSDSAMKNISETTFDSENVISNLGDDFSQNKIYEIKQGSEKNLYSDCLSEGYLPSLKQLQENQDLVQFLEKNKISRQFVNTLISSKGILSSGTDGLVLVDKFDDAATLKKFKENEQRYLLFKRNDQSIGPAATEDLVFKYVCIKQSHDFLGSETKRKMYQSLFKTLVKTMEKFQLWVTRFKHLVDNVSTSIITLTQHTAIPRNNLLEIFMGLIAPFGEAAEWNLISRDDFMEIQTAIGILEKVMENYEVDSKITYYGQLSSSENQKGETNWIVMEPISKTGDIIETVIVNPMDDDTETVMVFDFLPYLINSKYLLDVDKIIKRNDKYYSADSIKVEQCKNLQQGKMCKEVEIIGSNPECGEAIVNNGDVEDKCEMKSENIRTTYSLNCKESSDSGFYIVNSEPTFAEISCPDGINKTKIHPGNHYLSATCTFSFVDYIPSNNWNDWNFNDIPIGTQLANLEGPLKYLIISGGSGLLLFILSCIIGCIMKLCNPYRLCKICLLYNGGASAASTNDNFDPEKMTPMVRYRTRG